MNLSLATFLLPLVKCNVVIDIVTAAPGKLVCIKLEEFSCSVFSHVQSVGEGATCLARVPTLFVITYK